MTDSAASGETFRLAVQEYVAESRRERVDRFDPEMLTWLALPPLWTGRLAEWVRFPGFGDSFQEFLNEAAREGLCALSEASLADQPPWLAVEVDARLVTCLGPRPPDGTGWPEGTGGLVDVAELLEAIADISDQHARARTLAIAAGALSPPQLRRALEIAHELEDPAARARALIGVSAAQPPDVAAVTARAALGVAERLEDPGDRAETLLAVAGQGRLDGDAREECGGAVLRTLPELAFESQRSSILVRAARYLTPAQAERALAAAQALRAAEYRIEAVAGVTAALPAARAVGLLEQLIPAIAGISSGIARSRAARTLARRLADYGAADLAARAARTLADEAARGTALQVIARSLASAGASAAAVSTMTAAVSAYARGRADRAASLSALARELDSDDPAAATIAEQAAAAAVRLPAVPATAGTLVSLTAALVRVHLDAGDMAKRAMRAAAAISGPQERYQMCHRLLTALPESPLGATAIEARAQARAAAEAIADPADRIDALIALIPSLPPRDREPVVRTVRALAAGGTDVSFWMPKSVRAEVLQELRVMVGADFLHKQALKIAAGLLDVDAGRGRPREPLPPAVARWAELAVHSAADPVQAANWLDRRLAELIKEGDSAEAQAWTQAGRLLEPILGPELGAVVAVGLRRIELLYRRELDRDHLRRFLSREQQIEEFSRLINGGDETWAVHFLGLGGLGKTMLLRQITARLAPSLGIPTARIDFDHLSPDYPVTRPGQLLLQLLDELQAFLMNAQSETIADTFRRSVVQLHASVTQGSNDPLARIHDPQFAQVLGTFAEFIARLPQPVVFVIDTCEELSKRRAEGSGSPPVEATFEVLERLHSLVPSIRVVFAGRRPLARSGSGWVVSAAADAPGGAVPGAKKYLRVHEIRGFSGEEARRYLDSAAPGLTPELTAAILERSKTIGAPALIDWDSPRPDDGRPRYNPFSLNLYAGWAREDPTLRADTIAQGTTDPYVAIRIVRRLDPDLQLLLPAVALLRRFDASMLRGELDGTDARFETAYAELASQEWIDYQPDPSLNTTFLEVDRNLADGLRAYFTSDHERSLLQRHTRRRLGADLARMVRERPLAEIGVDLIDAAMRLPAAHEAAGLWNTVTDKLIEQCDWPWADQRTARLLGEDGAVANPRHPARAAVVAARIASLLHTRSQYDPSPDWQEVADRSGATPHQLIREWLRGRAIAGKVASYRLPGVELPSSYVLAAFWELLDRFEAVTEPLPPSLTEQLAASCCAALEGLVEVAELHGDASLVSETALIQRWLGRLADLVPADLLALAQIVAARSQAMHGRWEAALELARLAERSAAQAPVSGRDRWADYNTPAMTSHRIRLELVRMAAAQPLLDDPLGGLPLAEWQGSAEQGLGTIDADRLLAAILLRRLSAGLVPLDEVDRIAGLEEAAAERPKQSRSPLCCHRAVPPLFVALARCLAAAGRSDRAIALLHARRREALKADDFDAENAALTAVLEICRWMRTAQPVLAKNSGLSSYAGQRAAAWALSALTEQPGALPAECPEELDGAALHDWWRTRPTRPGQEDTRLMRDRTGQFAAAPGELTAFIRLSLALDLAEADLFESAVPGWGAGAGADPAELAGNGEVTAEELARLVLRMQALGHPRHRVTGNDRLAAMAAWRAPGMAPAVGTRRRAELAMDEGELLALRLPNAAALLLDLAASWFTEAGDPAGALFAGLAGTLARLRAGEAVPDLSELVARPYKALAAGPEKALPPWREIGLASPSHPPAALIPAALIPAELILGGWLLRLKVCAVRSGPEAIGTAAWSLKANRAGPLLRAGLEAVPAELDPAVLAWRGLRRRRRVQPRDRDTRRLPMVLSSIAAGVAGVGAALALVGYLGGRAGQAAGLTTTAGAAAALAALLLALGAVSAWEGPRRWLTDRLRVWWWARTVLAVRITRVPDSGLRSDETRVTIKEWRRGRLLSGRWRPSALTQTAVLPPMRAYGPAAEALPGSLREGLRRLAARVGPGWARVCLDIDPTLERMPWEALLSYPVAVGNPAPRGGLDFWRWGRSLPATRRPPRPGPVPPGRVPPRAVGRAVVVADSSRRLFAERAALAPELSFPDLSADAAIDVNLRLERVGSDPGDPPDVVLVIGRPVRLEYSVLLQTIEQVPPHGISAEDLREAYVNSGLLEAQVVAGLRARLFVVLGTPAEWSNRFDTERRDAADLRAWAGDVFRAGTSAVISLPSLDPQLAKAVLRDIAVHISDGITTAAVHEAVRAARKRIRDYSQPAPAAGEPPDGAAAERQIEQALDVCLFRRGRPLTLTTRPDRSGHE